MSRSRSSFDDIKKDFKKMYKHGIKSFKGFFGGSHHDEDGECHDNNCSYRSRRPNCWFGGLPFYRPGRSPWFYILLSPRMCVIWAILIVLILCGVSFYGILIIVLLGIIFILL